MLENVKAGDELLLHGFGTRDQVVEVERVTTKYIIAKGFKFSREDGAERPYDKWRKHNLALLTDEKRAEITARAQADYLQAFPWHQMSPETLNELAQWMHEHGFDVIPLAKK
jgi:hypothetical protein